MSGDVTIARDLAGTLESLGHEVVRLPYFPAKEIYWKPRLWAGLKKTRHAMEKAAEGADCWLTYGSYYKVPDVFGPVCAGHLSIPYFIFQASYAKNRGRKLKTWPGYMLNKRAMLSANHIFCNRTNDVIGCAKLLPKDRYTYIKPGLPDGLLVHNREEGDRLRALWGAGESTVIVTAAMMRAGVKAKGLQWTFSACADLLREGRDITLVVAGDGPRRQELEAEAKRVLGDRVRFLGLVDRDKLAGVFSAGDLFAFPGLRESVGMVYLEAQQCGLPVVATDDEGAPAVVGNGVSGIVTSADKGAYTQGIATLVDDVPLRGKLAAGAAEYVHNTHSARTNYELMTSIMEIELNTGRKS